MVNRYNYEEYFLLYLDNELSIEEKNAVEAFIRQNPDLEEELNMLKQSVIRPESDIIFEDKNTLFRKTEENGLIHLNNYEEIFLLYIDNELDHAGRQQLEAFLRNNPSLQNELRLLEQVKFDADATIVFPGKENLYREATRKPVWLFWISSAAAVAVLLVTGFLLFQKSEDKIHSSISTVATVMGRNDSGQYKNSKPAVTFSPKDSFHFSEASANNPVNKKQQSAVITGNEKNNLNLERRPVDNFPNRNAVDTIRDNNSRLIAKVEMPHVANMNTPPIVSIANDLPEKLIVIVDRPADGIQVPSDQHPDTKFSAANEEDLYTADESEKKTKLRGILRKVSRVFNKTANAEADSKHAVAIGSFQIALK